MRVTFNFELPDDASDLALAQHGANLWHSLWDYDQWLRNHIKHGEHTEEVFDALQMCRDKIHELLSDNNTGLDIVP